MKKFVISVISFVILCGLFAVILVFKDNTNKNQTYLRVHIRANSNLKIDQDVKYHVKEKIVDYLTPLLIDGVDFESAYHILSDNLENIKNVADAELKSNGFDYVSNVYLNEEYFPTRGYGDLVLENGYYDALIVELGSGTGDNWWCVIYPPLCFIGKESGEGKNIIYRSKLVEIVEKFFH